MNEHKVIALRQKAKSTIRSLKSCVLVRAA